MRLDTTEQAVDVLRVRRVAAENPVPPELEEIAEDDVGLALVRHVVRVGQPVRLHRRQQRRDLILREHLGEVRAVHDERPQHVGVPLKADLRDAVIGHAERHRARV